MTTFIQVIQRFFSNKIVSHRISYLMNELSKLDVYTDYVCISIERDDGSRQFCYFTVEELITLYTHCPANERTFYELILPTNLVKTYVDFEYNIDDNLDIQNHHIGIICCLKLFHHVFNFSDGICFDNENYINTALKQFLVLEASTTKKISYHLIHVNPTVLFENNITLGVFIKNFIHFFLSSVIQHKCSFFNFNFTSRQCSISDLIILLSPHIAILRTQCTKCYLRHSCITVAEIAHLIVLNKNNQWSLAIDLSVYSKNQQFRLFDCTKRGKNNFFRHSAHLPLYNKFDISYAETLKTSIITHNIEFRSSPILCFRDNKFEFKLSISTNLYPISECTLKILNKINKYLNRYFLVKTLSKFMPEHKQKNTINSTNPSQKTQKFQSFVENIITNDINHVGYIHSCISGTKNNNILFFNISGNYRFCPKKSDHHQYNSVAILIDTEKLTYAIRCKDAQCDNSVLIWNSLK